MKLIIHYLLRIPSRNEARYWPIVTFISRIFLLANRQEITEEIVSLVEKVKCSKVNPLFFKILIGISLTVALFEDNPSITSFTI